MLLHKRERQAFWNVNKIADSISPSPCLPLFSSHHVSVLTAAPWNQMHQDTYAIGILKIYFCKTKTVSTPYMCYIMSTTIGHVAEETMWLRILCAVTHRRCVFPNEMATPPGFTVQYLHLQRISLKLGPHHRSSLIKHISATLGWCEDFFSF